MIENLKSFENWGIDRHSSEKLFWGPFHFSPPSRYKISLQLQHFNLIVFTDLDELKCNLLTSTSSPNIGNIFMAGSSFGVKR
jgi:hypothetical protein